MGTTGKLSARKVQTITAKGYYGDGGGLWLQVTESAGRIRKSWCFRFTLASKRREMGLGNLDTCSLADARTLAAEARLSLTRGIDPIEARAAKAAEAKAEQARTILFWDCAEKYIAAHSPSWKNATHRAQWTSSLTAYAKPVLGHLAVNAIDTALVLKVIEPIWNEKTETASRVRQRIESILDWAAARGYRDAVNPARWKGHLDKILAKKTRVARVKHHPALPFAEIPVFMMDLRRKDFISARALEFTVLNASRTGEVIGAEWTEFNFAEKIWTIPGIRMKHKRDHKVPLCDRSLAILASIPREGKFVFAGARSEQHLSNMAMLELLKDMRPGITVHGFRSTFKDWATERTNFPNIVSEMALAHTVGDATEAAYRRGELLDKRRRLMREWERYCSRPAVADSKNIVAIKGGA